MSPTRCGNAPGTCDRTLLESGWLLRLRGFDHQHQVFLRIRPRPRFRCSTSRAIATSRIGRNSAATTAAAPEARRH
jgi:hypothetical protein